jgi:hypothetical protein
VDGLNVCHDRLGLVCHHARSEAKRVDLRAWLLHGYLRRWYTAVTGPQRWWLGGSRIRQRHDG